MAMIEKVEKAFVLPPKDVLHLNQKLQKSSRYFMLAGVLGLVLCAVGLLKNPQGFFGSYLTVFCFFLSITLGSLFFVMLQYLTRSAWSVTLRRIAETLAYNVVFMAVLAIPVLICMHEVYSWSRPEVMAADPLLQLKRPYLNIPFFYLRTVVYFGGWIVLASFFLRTSRLQDKTGDASLTYRMGRVAAGGMVFYALSETFFSFDWMMSLDSHWYSTLFGVYYFASSAVAIFCVLILIGALLHATGHLRGCITKEHYHDLGKLLFGFNCFWAFIAFAQFLLYWYTNIPEETLFYHQRAVGSWKAVSLLLPWFHFAVPFVYLMSYHVKRNLAALSLGAFGLLVLCFIDIYWLIQPNFHPAGATFGISDIGALLAVGGFYVTFFLHNLRQASPIPAKDPRIEECLSYNNGMPE